MKTINQLFEESVLKYGDNTFMLEKTGNEYIFFSYKDIQEQVYHFASGLIELGLKKGDRVALLAEGRNSWLISELGVLHAGGVSVPLSVKLGDASEIRFRLVHSGTKFLIVSGNQAPKVNKLKKELKELVKVIHLDEPEKTEEKDIYFGDVVETGVKILQKDPSSFEKTWKEVKSEDYATICYTSGTTSDPKGIILSHRNYTANVEQSLTLFDVPEWYRSLIILPWDHAFAHTVGLYTLMSCGGSIASVQVGKTTLETLKNIPVNIRETQPHFLLSVPALAKNFRKNIEKAISDKGKVASGLFKRALNVAYKYNGNGNNKGQGFRKLYAPMYKLYDKILFSKIRENFGGNLQFFVGGGALLDIELQRFFYAIGIPMYQGYGLTEASPVISSNNPVKHKMGSSGILVENIEVKICDEDGKELAIGEKGEIVVKGENVMVGYWNNLQATAETLVDGWLHTGDMGYLDEEGFLYVLGRFKSLLIADDGEKYSPEGMEEAFINQSAFIDQCMLYNNQNPYTVALVVPNKEAVKKWVKEEDLIPGSEQAETAVCKLFESELNEYRIGRKHEKLFPQRWLPAATAILEEGFTEDNHLMNSTLKVVRGKVEEKYKSTLEFLYTPDGKDTCNEYNRKTIREIFSNEA